MASGNGSGKASAVVRPGVCLALVLILAACAGVQPSSTPEKRMAPPESAARFIPRGSADDSRAQASGSLTAEGARLVAEKNFDGAIRVLEKAVGVNPQDGPACYFLAEAWIGKGDLPRAARFNDLAALYLRGDKEWSERVRSQKARIGGVGRDKM